MLEEVMFTLLCCDQYMYTNSPISLPSFFLLFPQFILC